MSDWSYYIHYVRRLQENHFDVLNILSGAKGFGKSSLAIIMAKDYLDKFSFVCPYCKNEFYKNLYTMEETENGYQFYIPEFIKNDKAYIKCPIALELDEKTGEKKKVSGCGGKFVYSQRKKIKWDPGKFIAYDNQDVVRKIFSLPQCSPIIADEAINFLSTLDHNKTESKELKKLFTVVRPKRFFYFFNIPELTWVDSKYREVMSTFWIRCIERGTAVIFERDKGEAKDKYHLKELEKIMGTVKFFTPMEKIKRSIRKHPCFFDMIKFKELDKKTYEEYEYVRNARNLQRQIEEQELSNKDIAKVMSWNLLRNWDRIQIEVNKSKDNRMTYNLLVREILLNPVQNQKMVSEGTLRNWIFGVDEYVKSKGKSTEVFEGSDLIDL